MAPVTKRFYPLQNVRYKTLALQNLRERFVTGDILSVCLPREHGNKTQLAGRDVTKLSRQDFAGATPLMDVTRESYVTKLLTTSCIWASCVTKCAAGGGSASVTKPTSRNWSAKSRSAQYVTKHGMLLIIFDPLFYVVQEVNSRCP